MTATSVSRQNGQTISSSGEANFQVGTLRWIRLEAGPVVHITEPGPHLISVTVHNQHQSTEDIRLSAQPMKMQFGTHDMYV